MRRPYPARGDEHLTGNLVVEDTAAYRYVKAFDSLKSAALSEPDAAEQLAEAAARAREAAITNRHPRPTSGRIDTEAEAV